MGILKAVACGSLENYAADQMIMDTRVESMPAMQHATAEVLIYMDNFHSDQFISFQ